MFNVAGSVAWEPDLWGSVSCQVEANTGCVQASVAKLADDYFQMRTLDAQKALLDETLAAYRQTVLTGFQEAEDNLTSLRILDEEKLTQDKTVESANQAPVLTVNQYKAGTIATNRLSSPSPNCCSTNTR